MALTFKLLRGCADGYVGRAPKPAPEKIYWVIDQRSHKDFIEPTFSPPVWGKDWINTQVYVLREIKQGILYYQPQVTEQ